MIRTEDTKSDLEDRVSVLKSVSGKIEQCRGLWTSRLPMTGENLLKIEDNLERLKKVLFEIKDLQTVSKTIFKKEKISYLESLLEIPNSYLKDIGIAKKNSHYLSLRSRGSGSAYSDLFLIDQMLCIAGVNDICMGVIRAEQVRNGNISPKDLDKYAIDKVRVWDSYSGRGEEIPDKTPRGIADTTWSIFWLMNPITKVDDKVLYDKISIGNFKSWSTAFQRRLIGIKYVEKVKKDWYEKWNTSGAMAELSKYRGGWTGSLCYPQQMLIYAAPELHIALMGGNNSNGNALRSKQDSYVA
jgi:hypothetical protein